MSGVRLRGVIRRIDHLFNEGSMTGLADSELLARFLARDDGTAFRVLIERHGPMVLSVCRATLREGSRIEDAFQATFLILIRKADTIQGRAALGAWLHQVAYRVALAASREESRRRKRERPITEASEPVTMRLREPLADAEERRAVHAEVARLPDKLRGPIVLCYLQGKSHERAAAELGCGEATLRRRLSSARDLLRSRLTRRGLAPAAAFVALDHLASSASATPVSSLWINTITGAVGSSPISLSATVVGLARSASTSMLIGKLQGLAAVGSLILAVGLIGPHTIPAGPALAQAGDPKATEKAQTTKQATAEPAPKEPLRPATLPDDRPQSYGFSGTVLGPNGKPFKGATLHLEMYGLNSQSVRATSDGDGRFRFKVEAEEFSRRIIRPKPDELNATLWAMAEGFIFDLVNVQKEGESPTLRLSRDDLPLDGRVVDEQGKPVKDAKIIVRCIQASDDGDLKQWLEAVKEDGEFGRADYKLLTKTFRSLSGPAFLPLVQTGADGSFKVAGIGRERVVTLEISHPKIETVQVRAITRPGETFRLPSYKRGSNENDTITVYGNEFTHIGRASRPIEGTVTDQDTGQPISNILVYREGSIGDALELIMTKSGGVKGYYQLLGRARNDKRPIVADSLANAPMYNDARPWYGPPSSVVEYTPYLRSQVKLTDPPGDGPIHLDIKLKRGIPVTGRVLDKATGRPVQGQIEYFVFEDNPHLSKAPGFRRVQAFPQHTAPDGSFGLVAFPGPGLLTVRAESDNYRFGVGIEGSNRVDKAGFLSCYPYCPIPSNSHTLAIINPAETDRTFKQDLLLDPGRSLTLNVVGPDGKPVTGSRIAGLKGMAYWESESQLPANSSTYPIVGLLPGRTRRITVKNDDRRLVGELTLQGDEPGPVTIKLEPWGEIVGRVVTPDGKPWNENASLHIVGHHAEDTPLGKDGRFHIKGIIPGRKESFYLQDMNQFKTLGKLFDDIPVKPGEVKDLGDLRFQQKPTTNPNVPNSEKP